MTNYYYYDISWASHNSSLSLSHSVCMGNLFSEPGLLQSSMNISIMEFLRKRKKKAHTLYIINDIHTQHTHIPYSCASLLYVSKSFFLCQTGKAKLYMKNRLCQANTLDAFFQSRLTNAGKRRMIWSEYRDAVLHIPFPIFRKKIVLNSTMVSRKKRCIQMD